MFSRTLTLASIVAIAATLLFSSAAFAEAPKVFLNGVDITGVAGQEFENATIRIDAQGNIHIDAPQYRVEVQGADNGSTAAAGNTAAQSAGSQYFLVAANTTVGATGYDVDIYVNGTLFKTMKNTDSQLVIDITDKLSSGANTVTFKAKKIGGPKVSNSNTDTIEIFVGKGSAAGNQLTIERQLLSFKVDASQKTDQSQNFTFDAK